MNEQQLIDQLTRETPVLPDVDVPSLESIEGLARRRSEVRHQLLAAGCLLINAAFVGVMSRRSNDAVAQANANTIETTGASEMTGAKGVISTPLVKSLTPIESPAVTQSNAVEMGDDSRCVSENGVRVFATVVEATRVFQFEAG